MLNKLHHDDINTKTRNTILNEFSKFGIFSDPDKDFIKILERLNNTDVIINIYDILLKSSSNINLETYANLLIDYCLKKDRYGVLNTCLKSLQIPENSQKCIQLDLINNFRTLVINNFSQDILRDNLFLVSEFLNDNVNYFIQNPIIFLAILFYTKDVDFMSVLKQNSFQIFDKELNNVIPQIMEKLPLIKALLTKKETPKINKITCYDLLDRHLEIDIKSLFSYHIVNTSFPHFSDPNLAKYNKKINFLFYIKQNRPSIACKVFYLDQLIINESLNGVETKLAEKKCIN